MTINRRIFLRNSAVVGTMAGTLALPSPAAAHQERDRYLHLQIEDDHAQWLVQPGDIVVYDTHDRLLRDRVTYVTLTNKSRKPYVCRARLFDGEWWAERLSGREWYGPMEGWLFQQHILGRAVAAMKHIV